MKQLLNPFIIALLALVACTVSSCGSSSEEENISEHPIQKVFGIVTDLTDPEESQDICSPMTAKLTVNWTAGTVTMDLTGLKIGASTLPKISLVSMPVTFDNDGWGHVSVDMPNVVSSTSGVSLLISDFKMKWVDRLGIADLMITSDTMLGYSPVIEMSFVLNYSYQVECSNQPMVLAGTTTSTGPDGNTYSQKKSVYTVEFDFANRTADISIYKASFASTMPQGMVMNFLAIPFTISEDGKQLMFRSEGFDPTMGGRPMTEFPILNLDGTLTLGQGFNLKFDCNLRKAALYHVDCKLDFLSFGDAK